jgi:CubicO group peptidase (beta-lactamase class C family)
MSTEKEPQGMRSHSLLLLAATLLVAATLHADERSDQIDEIFKKYSEVGSPGAAITVMQGDEIVYEKGYGLAQLEYEIPITTETIFHVASVSKQFTTFSIVLLAQEGKLSLDDDIRKHLPDFPDLGHTITIRHLIHHTSGVRDQWSLLIEAGWRFDDVITRDDIMKLLNKQTDLNFPPGDAHLYCNAGYTLLGEIVASISGKSLKEFTQERIFDPLGMTHTHFHDDHQHIVPQRAYSYSSLAQIDGFTVTSSTGDGTYRKAVLSYANAGATSLFTTGSDLMKWQRNFETGQVGGESTIELMLEKGTLNDGRELNYGFALSHGLYRGLRTIGHGGADAGFRSFVVRFPEHDLSIALVSNLAQVNSGGLSFKVADIFLEEAFEEAESKESDSQDLQTIEISPEELDTFKGIYLSKDYNYAYKLTQKEGLLRITRGAARPIDFTRGAARPIDLIHLGQNQFRAKDNPNALLLEIDPDAKGKVKAIYVTSSNTVRRSFHPVEKPTRSADHLKQYVGRYFCPELDVFNDITLDGKRLRLETRRIAPSAMHPLFKDGFGWRNATMRFERDNRGNITGFRRNSGRILNLHFDKIDD